MAKALVYGSMDPSSILASFIDFRFFPLISGNFLSWERVSGRVLLGIGWMPQVGVATCARVPVAPQGVASLDLASTGI